MKRIQPNTPGRTPVSAWGRLALVTLAAAALLGTFGHARASADTAGTTAVSLSVVTPMPIEATASVDLLATVAATDGSPICTDGDCQGATITFQKYNGPSIGWVAAGSPIPVTQVGSGPTAQAESIVSGFTSGSYPVEAVFQPNFAAGSPLQGSTSGPQFVTVENASIVASTTIVSATPPSLAAGSTTLSAKVTEVGASAIPSGTVTFYDNGQVLGDASLDSNGIATFPATGFIQGTNILEAAYQGSASVTPSSDTITLTGPTGAPAFNTSTTVTLNPSFIQTGGLVGITVGIVQLTSAGAPTTVPPPGANSVAITINGDPLSSGDVNGVPVGSSGVVPLGTDGTVTIENVSGWPTGGSYDIQASYIGSTYTVAGVTTTYVGSSGDALLSVYAPGSQFTPTFSYDTSHVSAVYGTPAVLGGTLLGPAGTPVANTQVTLSLGAESCSDTTDSNGYVSCSTTAPVAQAPGSSYRVTFSVAASTLLNPVNGGDAYDSFAVLPAPTSLAYNGDTAADYGDIATLSGTLSTAGGVPVGTPVTFTLGSQSCPAFTTDAAGDAACTITISQDPGAFNVGASFADSGPYSASTSDPTPFLISKAPTTLTVTMSDNSRTHLATLTGTLLANGVTPVAGRQVSMSLGLQSCVAVTNASGVALCTVSDNCPSGSVAAGSFAGDRDYLPSTSRGPTTGAKATTLTYLGATQGGHGDRVTLTAKLAETNGAALSGQSLTFTLGTQTCGATTSFFGIASCTIVIAQGAGSTMVSVQFAGTTKYRLSTTSTTFTITREQTTIAAHIAGIVVVNGQVSLSALLLDGERHPVANEPIKMSLGTATETCTATTNALGLATCLVPRPTTLGPTTFTATFAGDTSYAPSSTKASTLLCAFAQGGSFVIGDHDSGRVTFWSPQWSNQNWQSHGSTPSGFRGWVSGSFGPNCIGSRWTSNGNPTPPSGTLPTYMAVIETSSSTQSGSRYSGDSVHIVIVKTDAGYAGNPGHDGTGTVVATLS